MAWLQTHYWMCYCYINLVIICIFEASVYLFQYLLVFFKSFFYVYNKESVLYIYIYKMKAISETKILFPKMPLWDQNSLTKNKIEQNIKATMYGNRQPEEHFDIIG